MSEDLLLFVRLNRKVTGMDIKQLGKRSLIVKFPDAIVAI
jgi:hypothetical protein